jgi:hypothetical protein
LAKEVSLRHGCLLSEKGPCPSHNGNNRVRQVSAR